MAMFRELADDYDSVLGLKIRVPLPQIKGGRHFTKRANLSEPPHDPRCPPITPVLSEERSPRPYLLMVSGCRCRCKFAKLAIFAGNGLTFLAVNGAGIGVQDRVPRLQKESRSDGLRMKGNERQAAKTKEGMQELYAL